MLSSQYNRYEWGTKASLFENAHLKRSISKTVEIKLFKICFILWNEFFFLNVSRDTIIYILYIKKENNLDDKLLHRTFFLLLSKFLEN